MDYLHRLPADQPFVYGTSYAYRWGGACRHGMWLASTSFAGPSHGFVHMHCVVDDFGSLVPVAVTTSYGMEVS